VPYGVACKDSKNCIRVIFLANIPESLRRLSDGRVVCSSEADRLGEAIQVCFTCCAMSQVKTSGFVVSTEAPSLRNHGQAVVIVCVCREPASYWHQECLLKGVCL
jgi:hypothetical protein